MLSFLELEDCFKHRTPINIKGSYKFYKNPTYIISLQENVSLGGIVKVEDGEEEYEGSRVVVFKGGIWDNTNETKKNGICSSCGTNQRNCIC